MIVVREWTITEVNPALDPYRTLDLQREHRQRGIFVAEGAKIVERLLASPLPMVSAAMPPKWFQRLEPLLEARLPAGAPVFVAEKEQLEALSGFSFFQGVLAVGQVPKAPTLAELLQLRKPNFFAALDGIHNADNMGVIVRNCAAFGAQALLVGETCCSPWLRRSVRTSMGAFFQMPIYEVSDLAGTLCDLRGAAVKSVAAHPHVEGALLSQCHLGFGTCLVFGNEDKGVRPAVLEACDESVAVPMAPGVDSMNVASAVAVFCYELNRQRGRA